VDSICLPGIRAKGNLRNAHTSRPAGCREHLGQITKPSQRPIEWLQQVSNNFPLPDGAGSPPDFRESNHGYFVGWATERDAVFPVICVPARATAPPHRPQGHHLPQQHAGQNIIAPACPAPLAGSRLHPFAGSSRLFVFVTKAVGPLRTGISADRRRQRPLRCRRPKFALGQMLSPAERRHTGRGATPPGDDNRRMSAR
jgi:hypothetical protein